MKKTWLLLVFSLFFAAPVLCGCSGQVSENSAREQVEQEDAESPDAEDGPSEADDKG